MTFDCTTRVTGAPPVGISDLLHRRRTRKSVSTIIFGAMDTGTCERRSAQNGQTEKSGLVK